MITFKQIPRSNPSLVDMVTTQDLTRFIPQKEDKCGTKKGKKKTKKKK